MYNIFNLKNKNKLISNGMNNNLKNFSIVALVILFFVFYLGFNKQVSSRDSENNVLSGFAWNADDNGGNPGGMGWLSFNCLFNNSCGASNYSVVKENDGYLTGYAWAGSSDDSNINGIGWVKFGGLSGFPSGKGTKADNAKLNNDGTVTGWIRACAVFQSGCSGDYYHGAGPVNNILVAPNPNPDNIKPNTFLGGWDGWISLSGTGYGVTFNKSTGAFSGYAWGGSDVLGWINFSQVSMNSENSNLQFYTDATVVYPSKDPTKNYTTTLHWNATSNMTGCRASSSQSGTNWSTPSPIPAFNIPPSGSANVFVPYSPTTFTLTCNEAGPVSVIINRGTLSEGFNIGWTMPDPVSHTSELSLTDIKNLSSDVCTTSSVPSVLSWNGTIKSDGTETKTVDVPQTGATFTAKCKGQFTGNEYTRSRFLDWNSVAGSTKVIPKYIEN